VVLTKDLEEKLVKAFQRRREISNGFTIVLVYSSLHSRLEQHLKMLNLQDEQVGVSGGAYKGVGAGRLGIQHVLLRSSGKLRKRRALNALSPKS